MKNISSFLTKKADNYTIEHYSNNSVIYSSYYNKSNNNKNKMRYLSSERENSNLRSDNKKRPNKIIYSLHNQKHKSNTINYETNNKQLFNNGNINYTDSSNLFSYFSQKNNYLNLSTIPKSSHNYNFIPKIPSIKPKKSNNVNKTNIESNDQNKLRNLSLMNINNSNSSNLNTPLQKNNHSFIEVKSLTNDNNINQKKNKLSIKIKNNNSNNNFLNIEKNKEIYTIKNNNNYTQNKTNNTNKVVNINYNIKNKINLIINSKTMKYIPKNSEFKNIRTIKNIIKNNNKRLDLSSQIKANKYKLNKINSYFFSYIPKQTIKNKEKINKTFSKKNKKMTQENKLTLKNLDCKTFQEDFPIKMKYNRNYRINKKLKPQISLRLSLFKISKAETERYFFVNYFYSDNLRIPDDKNKSEFYF